MTETYDEKKIRLQRILDGLEPPILRTRVPLRSAEDISKLPQQGRDALAMCLAQNEKISFPKAIKILTAKPGIMPDELIRMLAQGKFAAPAKTAVDLNDAEDVAKYIYKCFPGMEENSIKGIAASEAMKEARALAAVLREINNSNHLRSDFVVVVMYAMFLGALSDMQNKIREIPAFIEAVKRTKLPWQD